MLDAHRLRVFSAVVAAGSVNKAAANLGYTPSAISQHISALQRETGLRLIERSGRGIEPTTTGQLLAKEAAQALERLAALDSVVADLRAGRVGRLSISYFASAGAAWIPPLVAALTQEFPHLRIDLRLLELAGEALSPDIEIFVEGAASSPARGYDVHPLLDDPYFVVLPENHALAGRESVRLGELAGERWVDNDFSRGACRQVVVDACASVGFSPGFHVETHDYPTAVSFVSAGVGITVLPELGLGPVLPPGLVAVPIVDPTPVRHISVRVRETLRENPAARRIVELLHERVRRGATAMVS
ncbi:MAG TPA: LysR family transcriptional regulator [Jiangellaceae bacterium]